MESDEPQFPHLHGHQLRDAELEVASHYFHYPGASVLTSSLLARHFALIPGIADLWDQARELETAGTRATLSSFVVDEGNREHLALIDEITDYAPRRGSRLTIKPQEDRLLEAATLRGLRAELVDLYQDIGDQAVGVDEAAMRLEKIYEFARGNRPQLEIPTHAEAVANQAKIIVEAAKANTIIGLPMPLRSMQERLGGWRPGRLHIIAAITSGHKTTMLRMAIEHMAALGFPGLLISYEDPTGDFAARSMVAAPMSSFSTTQLANADFGSASERTSRLSLFVGEVQAAIDRKLPMYLWDKPMAIDELIAFIYRATIQLKLKAIAIDFFQLIRSNDPRMGDVAHFDRVANRLQAAAKDLDVALIVAAQPTQSATHNATKQNIAIGLSDVKGAAAISQAAFALLALHFPMERIEKTTSVGGRKQTEVEYERVPDRILVVPRKWKSGPQLGSLSFGCDGAHDRIYDLEQMPGHSREW